MGAEAAYSPVYLQQRL